MPVTAAIITSETILLQVYSIGNVEAYSRGENSACHRQDFRVARAVEHFHDLCMVRSSKEVKPSEMVHRRPSELGDSLFEYLLQVPANRIGYTRLELPQLKILQEVITLCVFAPFSIFYMRQPLKLDCLWAGLR